MACKECLKLKERLKKEIIKPLFIEKEEYDFLEIFQKQAIKDKRLIRILKYKVEHIQTKEAFIKEKAEKPLREIIRVISEEYDKLFQRWLSEKKKVKAVHMEKK